MKTYESRLCDAKGNKCDVCGKQTTMQIRLEVVGRYGRKGSRSLGLFCQQHGDAKLESLRAKARRKSGGSTMKIGDKVKIERDDDPITDEWLRLVGLIDGDVRVLGVASILLDFSHWLDDGKLRLAARENGIIGWPALKTVGDVRTLVRLLGGVLKEGGS